MEREINCGSFLVARFDRIFFQRALTATSIVAVANYGYQIQLYVDQPLYPASTLTKTSSGQKKKTDQRDHSKLGIQPINQQIKLRLCQCFSSFHHSHYHCQLHSHRRNLLRLSRAKDESRTYIDRREFTWRANGDGNVVNLLDRDLDCPLREYLSPSRRSRRANTKK